MEHARAFNQKSSDEKFNPEAFFNRMRDFSHSWLISLPYREGGFERGKWKDVQVWHYKDATLTYRCGANAEYNVSVDLTAQTSDQIESAKKSLSALFETK